MCDEFDSPHVAMQFDIGNHWKYGATGDWIRTLGKRVYKLDVKGFSREKNKFTKIGEGDLDWADVRKALTEIKFDGWCAAEVGGGDLARLKEVSANMDRVFGLCRVAGNANSSWKEPLMDASNKNRFRRGSDEHPLVLASSSRNRVFIRG